MKFPKQGKVKKTGREFTQWREAVLERDGWACQRCGQRRNLQVHHIIKRSTLRLDTMENGVTLCADCHDDVESYRVSCTRNQDGLVIFRDAGVRQASDH